MSFASDDDRESEQIRILSFGYEHCNAMVRIYLLIGV